MSSHREAPEISKDPAADNTDVYAFVSPDKPDTVTLIANFIPFQNPDGGPNFYAFGKDVLYEFHIFNTLVTARDQAPDITYQFRFNEVYRDEGSFLYNLGTVGVNPRGAAGLETYPNLNRRQTYSVTKVVKGGRTTVLGDNIPVPPCNVGVHSTPNYLQYVPPAINRLTTGETVFAGQRAESFFFDLGSGFDLLDIRPLQFLHTGPLSPAFAVESFRGLNIFTIAIQVPKTMLTRDGSNPTDVMKQESVIGVYASASRRNSRMYEPDGTRLDTGPWQQVGRLANPLFNELLVGIGQKNRWNAQPPTNDADFLGRVQHPEISLKLPALYPLPFGNLANFNRTNQPRTDLVDILLTGIPNGRIPNFQNFTGATYADLMRLNMAVPVTANPLAYGVIVGDLQGFPNGRRPADDVVDIELKALAGATLPLRYPSYAPDLAAAALADFVAQENGPYLPNFPYLGTPNSGFATMPRPRDTGGSGP